MEKTVKSNDDRKKRGHEWIVHQFAEQINAALDRVVEGEEKGGNDHDLLG